VTAPQLPGLEQPAGWQIRHRSDPAARALTDRHYSRGRPEAPWVGPPGRVLVLVTGDETALWVTWVDPRLVTSPNPGYRFQRAGWTRDHSWTHRHLIRLRVQVTGR
jgi:hypothetical protein